MKPGKGLGAMLHEIREKQLQDELKTPRQAKAWVKKQIESEKRKAETEFVTAREIWVRGRRNIMLIFSL